MFEFIDLWAIGQRIKDLQEKSGMNAADFCKETDIPTSSFSQVVSGKVRVNIDTINKIVSRWRDFVDPLWLLFGDDSPTPKASSTPKENLNEFESLLLERVEQIAKAKENTSASIQKTIERITVFYTDNSFENYLLSNK